MSRPSTWPLAAAFCCAPPEHPEAAQLAERRQGQVVQDAGRHDQPVPSALLSEHRHACPERIGGRSWPVGLAIERHASRAQPRGAEDGPCQLRAPGADQPEEPHDLAGPERQVHVVEAGSAEALEREQLADRRALASRVDLAQGPPDHHADELLLTDRGGLHGAHALAILEDRDAVGDAQHLVEAVGHVDDGPAVLAEGPQDGEEALQLLVGQDGRRLVEDDHAGRASQGLGDLHHLPLRDAQVVHAQMGIDALEAQRRQALAGLPMCRRPVHDARGQRRQLSEQQVLRHAQLRHEAELLVDGPDALVTGVVG